MARDALYSDFDVRHSLADFVLRVSRDLPISILTFLPHPNLSPLGRGDQPLLRRQHPLLAHLLSQFRNLIRIPPIARPPGFFFGITGIPINSFGVPGGGPSLTAGAVADIGAACSSTATGGAIGADPNPRTGTCLGTGVGLPTATRLGKTRPSADKSGAEKPYSTTPVRPPPSPAQTTG